MPRLSFSERFSGEPGQGIAPLPPMPRPRPSAAPGLPKFAPIAWPVPGHYDLNERDQDTRQGDGRFGWTRNGGAKFHGDIDITAPEGTPVVAVAPGKIVAVNFSGTYGKQVVIRHDGDYYSHYAHLGATAVKVGAPVRAGEAIGSVGRTGNVQKKAQSHLHFEIRVGSPLPRLYGGKVVDPLDYLRRPR
jgi:murein DD-endopeptidase MepM/ murein hydrolase activator NlpD